MATQVITKMVDDLDESLEADGTYKFVYDGVHYEIDLADKHKAEMDRALAKYVKAARRTGGRQIPGSNKADGERKSKAALIREWAPGAGFTVGPTGKIPAAVTKAYDAAHPAA